MAQQELDLRDVCANRHRGNRQSAAANRAAAPTKAIVRERIRVMVKAAGRQGVTGKEIAQLMGRHPNEVSGRITELKRDAVIFDSGRARERSAVLVGEAQWANGSATESSLQ